MFARKKKGGQTSQVDWPEEDKQPSPKVPEAVEPPPAPEPAVPEEPTKPPKEKPPPKEKKKKEKKPDDDDNGAPVEKKKKKKKKDAWPSEEKKKKKEKPNDAEAVAAAYLASHGAGDDLDALIHQAILESSTAERKRLGAIVDPSPHEVSELEMLSARIAAGKAKKKNEDEEEEEAEIDFMDKPRILLKQGRLLKEGTEALIKRSTWREAFLFNDAFALGKADGASLIIRSFAKFDDVSNIEIVYFEEDEKPQGFEFVTSKRRFRIVGAGESKKEDAETMNDWRSAVIEAFLAYKKDTHSKVTNSLGWRHKFITGTPWWLFAFANAEQLTAYKDHGLSEEEETDKAPSVIFSASSVNDLDDESLAPCHLAAAWNRVDALNLLLGKFKGKANVLTQNSVSTPYLLLNKGATPLHFAAAAGSFDCAMELLGYGADPGARDDNGDTPFDAAATSATCEDIDAATRLSLFHVLPRQPAKKQETVLHVAARRDFPHLASVLAGLGFDLEARDADGDTPLMVAAKLGHVRAASSLLDAGARPNAKDLKHQKFSAVDFALRRKRKDMVVALVSRGARKREKRKKDASGSSLRRKKTNVASSSDEDDDDDLLDEDDDVDEEGDDDDEVIANALEASRREFAHRDLSEKEMHDLGTIPDVYALPRDKWQPDTASIVCTYCDEPFSSSQMSLSSRRRHHCRSCGSLVCGDCSTRTAKLRKKNEKDDVPHEKHHGVDKHRICDVCFNKLDAMVRYGVPAEKKKKVSLFESLTGQAPTENNRGRKANDAKEALTEFGNELKERGEHLKELDKQTADIHDNASEFRSTTRRLSSKYEKKAKSFFSFGGLF